MVLTSHGVIEGTENATGWYLPECSHPYFKFKEAGYDITFCSIKGGDTTVAPSSLDMNDEENKLFWETPENKALTEGTRALSEFDGNDFDVIFFVGGFGTMWDFPFDTNVSRVAAATYEKGGVIGAVCHGPIALANITLSTGELLVSGKSCAGFCNEEEAAIGLEPLLPMHEGFGKSCEDVLQAKGGIYTKTAPWGEHVVSDSRVVTGQNPASARKCAQVVIEVAAGL